MNLSQVVVRKRNEKVEPFDVSKIEKSIHKCLAPAKRYSPETPFLEEARRLAADIAKDLCGEGGCLDHPVSVETIQDAVEKHLMANEYYDQAKAYILFREKHREQREAYPTDPSEAELVARNVQYFKTPIQVFQFYDKYSRWREDLGRRETWEECVDRSLGFLRAHVEQKVGTEIIEEEEWSEAKEYVLNLRALPSMRLIQMAGPALERCNSGLYNCAYLAIDSLDAFTELLYLLMQGCGVGFSVESEYTDKLPRVKKQKRRAGEPPTHQVPDSTEGWCNAFKHGLKEWFSGRDVVYDFTEVRPQGARLVTKGGRASGPGPLKDLLDFTRARVLAREGKRLSPLDCHDIACKAGDIVQVGGVRRSAEISLSDLDDEEMRYAKHGQFYLKNPQRAMSNNSAVYEERPTSIEFMEEWLSLAQSESGERGIFNREGIYKQIPKRRKKARFGLNPCGEIILRIRQFCNLVITVARKDDTLETLSEKIRVATFLGTCQSVLTDFGYISDEWKRNCEEERLLGVDITGQMDCPILRPGAENREKVLRELRDIVIETNLKLSERLGINQSAAVTCVKPGGNSSQLLDCGSGFTPRHAPYYIRRVRVGAFTPIAALLKECGVPWHTEIGQRTETATVLVFEFPIKAPEGAFTRSELSAVDELESWLVVKTNYTEHNPSFTVYVRDDEWLQAGNWVYQHWNDIGGLSFLPYNGGTYALAPFEEITKEHYERLESVFPSVDYAKLPRFEKEDMTNRATDFACTSGECEL
jgi:ribonucleoside-diphosphate reductase alpha chain